MVEGAGTGAWRSVHQLPLVRRQETLPPRVVQPNWISQHRWNTMPAYRPARQRLFAPLHGGMSDRLIPFFYLSKNPTYVPRPIRGVPIAQFHLVASSTRLGNCRSNLLCLFSAWAGKAHNVDTRHVSRSPPTDIRPMANWGCGTITIS